jgi:flagellar hook-associated protein 1 FlgK
VGADFAALNVALSSLYAQRRGLEVTGQNVANANTAGYSRQRVVLNSVGGSVVPAIFATSTGVGEGVRYSSTERVRDMFLETRSIAEHGALAKNRGDQQVLFRIEQMFGEPGDNGLQSMLGQFWNGFDDIANHPEDMAARAQLLQRAQTLVTGFHQIGTSLEAQWGSYREQLSAVVDEVNATAANVASLNEAILAASRAGLSPNDLMDRRDLLVQKLADLTGVTTRQGDDGVVDVYLGGTALVRGSRAELLKVSGGTTFDGVGDPSVTPQAGTVSVQWAKDSYPVTLSGGSTAALTNALNSTIPSYRFRLDAIASDLVDAVNDLHVQGFGLDGVAGGNFFAIDDPSRPMTTLKVAITDPTNIAASGIGGGPNHDGSIALKLAELAGKGPDQDYRKLIVGLGVDSQTAQRRAEIQQSIADRIDAYRDADSGVNLDEEMTNMVAYQQAYNAAARFLTTIDEMLDTLINRTGLVGR